MMTNVGEQIRSDGSAQDQPSDHIDAIPDCAVCLQQCLHPVKLECLHIFCYLCVKGVAATQPIDGKRCPMCRRPISPGFLINPNLVDVHQAQQQDAPAHQSDQQESDSESVEKTDDYKWFYEGRNGWWEYDPRTALDLEMAFKAAAAHQSTSQSDNDPSEDADEDEVTQSEQPPTLSSCELLIAGFLYVVDFEQMVQHRRNDPNRRRRIKRDLVANVDNCKGVAGLRLPNTFTPTHTSSQNQMGGSSLPQPLVASPRRRVATSRSSTAGMVSNRLAADASATSNDTLRAGLSTSVVRLPADSSSYDVTSAVASLTLSSTERTQSQDRRYLPADEAEAGSDYQQQNTDQD